MTAAAVILALGVAALAPAAPEAKVIRLQGGNDARVAELSNSVRAELTAVGFTVLAPLDPGPPSPASAVVRLRIDDHGCALVTAIVLGSGTFFQTAVGCDGGTGTDRRAGDQAALQLAEWMAAALWLPPAQSAPAAPPAVRAPLQVRERKSALDAPVPPSLVVDIGTAMLRTPALGTRFGIEMGVALYGRSPVIGGSIAFARLSFAYEWLGTEVTDDAGERFDASYETVAIAVGVEQRLSRDWSVEANANFGLTLIALAVQAPAAELRPAHTDRPETVPGAAVGIVRHIGDSSSLAFETRATWLAPGFRIITPYASMSETYWPAITFALALRTKL